MWLEDNREDAADDGGGRAQHYRYRIDKLFRDQLTSEHEESLLPRLEGQCAISTKAEHKNELCCSDVADPTDIGNGNGTSSA